VLQQALEWRDQGKPTGANGRPATSRQLSETELGDIWIGAKHDPEGWVAAGQSTQAEMDQVLRWARGRGLLEPELRLVEGV